MSSSSLSTPPNPSTSTSTTSRRRLLDHPSSPLINLPLNDTVSTPPLSNLNLQQHSVPKIPLPNLLESTTTPHRRTSVRKAAKPPKPKWLTISRLLTKNLIMFLVVGGLVQIVRKLYDGNYDIAPGDDISVISADWEGKYAEMNLFMKKTTKMIQVQVDVIDRKVEKHVGSVREEIERRDVRIDEKLGEFRRDLEKGVGEKLERLLSKEEFEEYLKGGGRGGESDGVSLDDVRVYAKEVVEKEIEKHAADGLGRVDYALGSSGGRVVKHSEAYLGGSGAWDSILGRSSVHRDAEMMLTPSFGEPGKCFPLKGSSGYVIIRLRTAVVPEAVTLEHVAESVAYDRSSAPKDCRISGLRAQAEEENEKMFLLSEFTYDLQKSNAQTFKVLDSVGSSVVDTIRFDFVSNHGSSSHTCVYRLRVHGLEPSLSMLVA